MHSSLISVGRGELGLVWMYTASHKNTKSTALKKLLTKFPILSS